MINSKILEFQNKIKIKFNNLDLLKKSLVHKSHDSDNNNEKLEFLGDRVLGLILSKTLLKNYPAEKEGIIDKKFANLVNKKTCAKVGASLNIIKYMTLGESFKNQNRSDEKIISDGLEALIGAIFLDKGLEISEKFILTNWKEHLNKSQITLIDAKTKLQEYCLKKYKKLPKYKTYRQTGPQHSPIFKVEVQIPYSKVHSAAGESKKKAEQNAANKLLIHLNYKI
jgi:ribonuclease III